MNETAFTPGRLLRSLFAPVLALAATATFAQQWPTKPIHLVVPYAAGGTTDVLARPLAQKLSEALGQPVVVENKAGANGIIGTAAVAKAAADGYTLLVGSSSIASNEALGRKLPFDTLKDLQPVSMIAYGPTFLFASPSFPYKTLKDLVAAAKAKPGSINYASAGIGGTPHLASEMFNTKAGVKLVHVPYKGVGPAVTDLIAGHVGVMFTALPPTLAHVREGRLKVLAVASQKRSQFLPDVPSVAEAGYGFEAGSMFGILAPAGTPEPIVRRLSDEIRRIVNDKEINSQFTAAGAEPRASSPEEYTAFVKDEIERLTQVIKAAGVQGQ